MNLYDSHLSKEKLFRFLIFQKLNTYYGKEIYPTSSESIRIGQPGVGIIIQNDKDSLSLHPVTNEKLIEGLFNKYGMQITNSDAGLKITRLIKQIGGLENCNIFKIKGARELLMKFKPHEHFTKQHAVEIIGQNDSETHKPKFEKYENLYLYPRKIGTKLKPDNVFEYFAKNGGI